MASDLAVGVAYVGSGPPEAAWSGIPAGLARGLTECGYGAVMFDAELPKPLARAVKAWGRATAGSRSAGQLAPSISRMRASLGSRRARSLEAGLWIVCGRAVSEAPSFSPRDEITFADMTVKQAVALDNEGFSALPRKVLVAMQERQRRRHLDARACCVASDWAAHSLVSDYGVDRRRVHVVGFGRNVEPRLVERDWSSPRFLFVGKDWHRKNGDAIVRAFAAIRAEIPSASLDIVGDHPRVEVEGVVGHGALSTSARDDRERLCGLFERATCFVMPSYFEAFGIAYVEAGASGVPSIGTVRGGAATAVGKGGLLVDPFDEAVLLDAMRHLADPTRAAELGRVAYEHSRGFSWRGVASRILRAAGHTPAGE